MTVRNVVRNCLLLLTRREQLKLAAMTIAQMATGLLDLLGVLLIGLVSVLSVSVVSGGALPSQVVFLTSRFGDGATDDATLAAWLCLIAGFLLVAKTGVSLVINLRTLRFLANREASLSGRLTEGLLSRPLLEVQAKDSQDVAYTLTVGTQSATVGVLGSASSAIADAALLVVLGVGLTAVDPFVMAFSVLYFGTLALVLQKGLSNWASRTGSNATLVHIASYMAIQEVLASYREVMVSNRRGLYVERIQRMRWQSASLSANAQFMGSIPKYTFEIAIVVGALALAATQLASKELASAVGIIAVFLVAGSRVVPAMVRLQGAALYIRTVEASASMAVGLAMEIGTETPRRTDQMGLTEIRRHLRDGHTDFCASLVVRDLWLTYPGTDLPALAGISFNADEGASIAFVGSTGAGKSTLADLLLGVVDPDKGSVAVCGMQPAQAIARWPGGVAYVPQQVALANGTVRDNVALGLPLEVVDDDWVWEALERAHLATFLRDNREGLETVVGENGMRLSGGQRQRLGVARALFTHPKLLVLDEATSALDAETEQAISHTMRELEGSVTTVTIAHRLATVRHCDKVIYLEGGRLIADGTFDQVRRQSAAFNHQASLLGL